MTNFLPSEIKDNVLKIVYLFGELLTRRLAGDTKVIVLANFVQCCLVTELGLRHEREEGREHLRTNAWFIAGVKGVVQGRQRYLCQIPHRYPVPLYRTS